MAVTEADTETEEEAEGSGLRSQMWKHEMFVEWAKDAFGVDLNEENAPTVIAWFAAKRNHFRKSDIYLDGVKSHSAEMAVNRAARQEARDAAKAAKPAEKEAAAAASEAEDDEEDDSTIPVKRARKTPARKAPARRTRKAASSDEDPFS